MTRSLFFCRSSIVRPLHPLLVLPVISLGLVFEDSLLGNDVVFSQGDNLVTESGSNLLERLVTSLRGN